MAWMAQSTVSSKRMVRYASAASWRARMAAAWNLEKRHLLAKFFPCVGGGQGIAP